MRSGFTVVDAILGLSLIVIIGGGAFLGWQTRSHPDQFKTPRYIVYDARGAAFSTNTYIIKDGCCHFDDQTICGTYRIQDFGQ